MKALLPSWMRVKKKMMPLLGRPTPQSSLLGKMSSLSSHSLFISPLRTQGWPCPNRKWKKCKGQRGWRTPRKQGSLNQHEQDSQRRRQHAQGLHSSAPDPLCLYSNFQFSVFYGIPQCVNAWVSDSCAFSWALFLGLFCLVQLWCDSFCFILLYFILFLMNEWMNK